MITKQMLIGRGGSLLKGKTSKNLVMYLAYSALRYVTPVVLTPFLAHALAKQQFADLVILNSCVWTSTVFMEFGFYLYGVSKTAAAVDRVELSRTLTAITLGKAVLAPLALLVYLGLAFWSGLLLRNPAVVIIGAFSALGFGGSFAWFFQGQQRGGTAVLMEAVPQAIYFALILMLIRGPGDLWLAAAAQTIQPIMSLAVAIALIKRSKLWGRLNFSHTRQVMSEAFPYFIERFCFTLYTAVTPTLVAVLSTASEVSYYSIGDRVGIFLGTLPTPIFQAVVPLVSRMIRREGGGWRLSLTLIAAVMLFVGTAAAVTYVSIGAVITRFFSSSFHPAISVARLFCINSVVSVLGATLANFVIIPRNVPRIMAWSSSIALVCGFIAQLLLVPSYGAVGAVLSRTTSEAIVAGILGVVVIKMLTSDLMKRRILSGAAEATGVPY